MKCLNCGKTISDKAKYCSDKCRMAFTRANTNPNKLPEQSNPNKSNPNRSVPLKEKQNNGKVLEYGKCHGCGKDVPDYICICYDCFKKGITHKSLGLEICEEVVIW